MPKTFNIALTGKVAAGHTRQAVAASLAKMMRLPEERALELLSGKETVIKRNLDEPTVARYIGAFGPTGAEIRAEEIDARPPAAAAPPASKPQAPVAAAPVVETIKCPACGTEQPKRNLCRQCGGDIRRLLTAKTEAASAPSQEVSSTPIRGGVGSLPGTVRVEQDSSMPHPLNMFSFTGRIGRLRYLAFAFPAYLPLLIGVPIVGGVFGVFTRSIGVIVAIMIVGGLASACLGVRVAVLRLHDLNLSGKWVLLPLLPLLSFIPPGSLVLMIGSVLFLVLGSLALCLWPGSMMSNDYGPPPGPNTFWTILGAVLFILMMVVGGLSGGRPDAEG